MASTLGIINPLRYCGCVYDHETGLYYLQSRYYDPEMGRFINADAFPSTGQGIIGNNMFAYCGSNPSSRMDNGGYFWDIISSRATDFRGIHMNEDKIMNSEVDLLSTAIEGIVSSDLESEFLCNS